MLLMTGEGVVASTTDINAVLEALKSIATAVLEMVGSVVQLIMNQPLLLIPFGVIMLYTVIATAKRFLH